MKYIIQLLFVILLFACNDHQTPTDTSHSTEETIDTEPDISHVQLQSDTFLEIDSSGILMFPLGLDMNKKRGGNSSYKKDRYNFGYWNIIFYNGHTSHAHVLTKDKIYITDYSFVKEGSMKTRKNQTLPYIFYQAITKDYNQDGELDSNDPSYLFVSDKQGKNFRQISPDNYDMKSWEYVQSLDKIILQGMRDVNGDLKYNEEDELVFFEIGLEPNSNNKQIFKTDFQKEMKSTYARHWVSKED